MAVAACLHPSGCGGESGVRILWVHGDGGRSLWKSLFVCSNFLSEVRKMAI